MINENTKLTHTKSILYENYFPPLKAYQQAISQIGTYKHY